MTKPSFLPVAYLDSELTAADVLAMQPVERDEANLELSALPRLSQVIEVSSDMTKVESPESDVRKALKTHLEALWRKSA